MFVKFTCGDDHAVRVYWIDGKQADPAMNEQRYETTGGWSSTKDNWVFQPLRDDEGRPIEIELEAGAHMLDSLNIELGLAIDYIVLVRVR